MSDPLQSTHVKAQDYITKINFCLHISLYGKVKIFQNITFTIQSVEPSKVHSNAVHYN